jgi:hypothetical protein
MRRENLVVSMLDACSAGPGFSLSTGLINQHTTFLRILLILSVLFSEAILFFRVIEFKQASKSKHLLGLTCCTTPCMLAGWSGSLTVSLVRPSREARTPFPSPVVRLIIKQSRSRLSVKAVIHLQLQLDLPMLIYTVYHVLASDVCNLCTNSELLENWKQCFFQQSAFVMSLKLLPFVFQCCVCEQCYGSQHCSTCCTFSWQTSHWLVNNWSHFTVLWMQT